MNVTASVIATLFFKTFFSLDMNLMKNFLSCDGFSFFTSLCTRHLSHHDIISTPTDTMPANP